MRRIWYDFEFLENGSTIFPISVGMVDDQGRELYLVNEDTEGSKIKEKIRNHDFLMGNVIPHLPLREKIKTSVFGVKPSFVLDWDDNTVVSRRYLVNAVRDFTALDVNDEPDGGLQLWGWYSAYDHVALMQLFGPMVRKPAHLPMFTNDLKQEVDRIGGIVLPSDQTGTSHRAIDDARELKMRHLWLESRELL